MSLLHCPSVRHASAPHPHPPHSHSSTQLPPYKANDCISLLSLSTCLLQFRTHSAKQAKTSNALTRTHCLHLLISTTPLSPTCCGHSVRLYAMLIFGKKPRQQPNNNDSIQIIAHKYTHKHLYGAAQKRRFQ